MAWRMIHFKTAKAPEVWRYRVGSEFTLILEPNGKRHNIRNSDMFTGARNGSWNTTGIVVPSAVKFYIHLYLRLGARSNVPGLPARPSYQAGKEAVLELLSPAL